MVWSKNDHKKYGFVLVLYVFRYITSLKLEKSDTAKLSRKGFIYNKKDKCLYHIFKHNAKFLEFWFTYRSDHNTIVF